MVDQDHQAILVIQDHKVKSVQMVSLEHPVRRARMVFKVTKVTLVKKVLRDMMVHKALKV